MTLSVCLIAGCAIAVPVVVGLALRLTKPPVPTPHWADPVIIHPQAEQ